MNEPTLSIDRLEAEIVYRLVKESTDPTMRPTDRAAELDWSRRMLLLMRIENTFKLLDGRKHRKRTIDDDGLNDGAGGLGQ
jgi:hypothetical protein